MAVINVLFLSRALCEGSACRTACLSHILGALSRPHRLAIGVQPLPPPPLPGGGGRAPSLRSPLLGGRQGLSQGRVRFCVIRDPREGVWGVLGLMGNIPAVCDLRNQASHLGVTVRMRCRGLRGGRGVGGVGGARRGVPRLRSPQEGSPQRPGGAESIPVHLSA